MKTNEKASFFRSSIGTLATTLVFGAALSVAGRCERVVAADSVRVLQTNAANESEETTFEGTIESISPDEIALAVDGSRRSISSETVVWAQFADEPVSLPAVRAALQLGDYEEALEKLDDISTDETKGTRPWVAQEIDWLKAQATARLALAGGEKLENGGRAVVSFVASAPSYFRFYDANALAGEILTKLGKNAEAAKYFAPLDAAASPTTRARGKLALAEIALRSDDLDGADALFAEVAKLPDASTVSPFARIGAARVATKRGRFDDAEKALAAVLAATPNSATLLQATIYNALGANRVAAGKNKEAIVAYLHVELLYRAARAERVEALEALVELWTLDGRSDRADAAKKTLDELKMN